MLNSFEYLAPKSLEECLRYLGRADKKTALLAGGTVLLPNLRVEASGPDVIIDMRHLEDLKKIHQADNHIIVGALNTVTTLQNSAIIQEQAPVLVEMAHQFGNPLIRSVATVGGNMATASPVADIAVPLLALDATLRLRASDHSSREIALHDFFVGPYQTVIDADELIVDVTFPSLDSSFQFFYHKLKRRKGSSPAIICIAVVIQLSSGKVRKGRIALGGVAPVPILAKQVEATLDNEMLTEGVIEKCVSVLESDISPIDDKYASAEYRTAMAKTFVRRALRSMNV